MEQPGSDGEERAALGYPPVGEELGHYVVGRRLGVGGMGWVFEALDTKLQRQVAVKVIAPHLARDAGFRERFVREATAQASLESPHVVHVYDHGQQGDQQDGRLYLVTQLVPDGDLKEMLERLGVPPRRTAVDLVGQVAAGLADVHAAGLVHRDVKPANVLLRHRDEGLTAYLGDFGIARQADADQTPPTSGSAGTPRFMAPELHTGAGAGPRTDVYSLGCLLWTALTGTPPYDGSSEWEVVSAHRDEPVPRLPGDGALVEGLNRVLARSLAKDPADRYADAAGVRDDLRALLALPEEGHAGPVTAVDPPPRRPLPPPQGSRTRVVALVIGLLVVVAAAVVAWALTWGGRDPQGDAARQPTAGAVADQARAAAVASVAEALVDEGLLDGALATCAAERWVDGAGLAAMRSAGVLDARYSYVDRPGAALPPEVREAVRGAVRSCVRGASPG